MDISSAMSALRSRISKPRSSTLKYKLGLLGLFVLSYHFFYILPNFYPLSTPTVLPLSVIDKSIPFVPWTFLIYLSEYLLIVITIISIKELNKFKSFAQLSFGVLFFIGPIFILWPTTYPRPPYPANETAMVAFAMNLVAKVDMPTNCLPSLHVATTSVAVYSLRHLRKWLPLFACWGLAIFGSTLTTKQHYVVDVLAGLMAAILVIGLQKYFLEKNQHGWKSQNGIFHGD